MTTKFFRPILNRYVAAQYITACVRTFDVDMKMPQTIVELKNATIQKYGRDILSSVDFSLVQGEFCYILGHTGSGKTTLLEALYGSAQITGDATTVMQQDISTLNRESLPYYRRKLGMVFQNILLLEDMTVRENYDFVLRATDWVDKAKRDQRIDEVLQQINMNHMIDQPVTAMSGGEQQTIAIGRAILNTPQIIITDEPTGNLDRQTSEKVLLLLRDMAAAYGASVILSTHDMDLFQKYPSRYYTCENGTLQGG